MMSVTLFSSRRKKSFDFQDSDFEPGSSSEEQEESEAVKPEEIIREAASNSKVNIFEQEQKRVVMPKTVIVFLVSDQNLENVPVSLASSKLSLSKSRFNETQTNTLEIVYCQGIFKEHTEFLAILTGLKEKQARSKSTF